MLKKSGDETTYSCKILDIDKEMKRAYSVEIVDLVGGNKKYRAIFKDKNGEVIRSVDFGAKGYSDYTIHRDPERKRRYIQRHGANENWTNKYKPGTLSRYILWNKPTLSDSLSDYKRIFNLK